MNAPRPAVLLVDDSELFRSMLRVYLTDLPVDVLEADDGDSALALLAKVQVQLVVADLSMPRMGGLELLAAMRTHSRPDVRHTPFALLTSEEQGTDDFFKARAAQVDGFLSKPVRPKVFRDLVQQLALTRS